MLGRHLFPRVSTWLPLSLTALVLLVAPQSARGQEPSSDMVHARIEAMKANKRDIRALADLIETDTPADPEALRALAQAIADRGGDTLVDQFPPGSALSPTEALPEVWNQPETFARLAQDQTAKAMLLAQLAEGRQSLQKSAFRALGGTCRACHDKFKE